MNTDFDIHSRCFLCKQSATVTMEHVFPKWLQHEYSLWDQFIVLRNGNKFRYKDLTIPCCSQCNGTYLSALENKISRSVKNQDISLLRRNSDDTFIWLYKIMYGLHYKEMFLKENIKDQNSKSIEPKETFTEVNTRNLFPMFVRGVIKFNGFKPYSLFVFGLREPHPAGYFYVDEPGQLYSSIVLGNIGIVCSFQCDGYIEDDLTKTNNIQNIENLSLAEFADFSSFVLCLKSRMKRLPNYLLSQDQQGITFRIQPSSNDNRYSEFDIKKQYEIMTKYFVSFFEPITSTDAKGERSVSYKSPFVYF